MESPGHAALVLPRPTRMRPTALELLPARLRGEDWLLEISTPIFQVTTEADGRKMSMRPSKLPLVEVYWVELGIYL
jgi:hypothetical protein